MTPTGQVYRVIVQTTPRGEFRTLLRTENLNEAIGKSVTWLRANAVRTKGSARVITDDDGRLVYEVIGDARGERISIVFRHPGRRRPG